MTKPIRRLNQSQRFPSNTDTGKTIRQDDREPRESLVGPGAASVRKPTFINKLTEAFLGDETSGVADYVLYDVIVPAVKATITELVTGSLEMALFGRKTHRGGSGSQIRRVGSRSYTQYGGYGINQNRGEEYPSRGRGKPAFDQIVFKDRPEAEDVLAFLTDLTIQYGQASVADFYDLSGITASFVDDRSGWTDLAEAYTVRVRDGYIIQLPRPQMLD